MAMAAAAKLPTLSTPAAALPVAALAPEPELVADAVAVAVASPKLEGAAAPVAEVTIVCVQSHDEL